MGATPVFGFRFPEPPDPADVPTDMHELALDVETAINGALVPKPVVNGRFVKGVGGAAVWAALTAADIPPIGDAQIAAGAAIDYRKLGQQAVIQLSRSAPASIPNAAQTHVPWDVVNPITDPHAIFSLDIPSGSVTTTEAGWYLLTSYLVYAANVNGIGRIVMLLAGTGEVGRAVTPPAFPNVSAAIVVRAAANTAFQVDAFQDSGGPLNVNGTFSVARLGS